MDVSTVVTYTAEEAWKGFLNTW